MKIRFSICALLASTAAVFGAEKATVIPHEEIRTFTNNGNSLMGVATPDLGAKESEVWHSEIAVGSCTPKHYHESEEIFILIRGKLKAVVDGEEYFAKAPATLILPAGSVHQLFNDGDEPTEQIVVLPIKSKIYWTNGDEMELPWRN